MHGLRNTAAGVDVEITWDELTIICNALNEVCNGLTIGDSEFQTRIGFHRDYVRALLDRAKAINSN